MLGLVIAAGRTMTEEPWPKVVQEWCSSNGAQAGLAPFPLWASMSSLT